LSRNATDPEDWYETVGISWPCRWRRSGGCGVLRRTEPI